MRPHDGCIVRILNLIDECTRERLLIRAERRSKVASVHRSVVLTDQMALRRFRLQMSERFFVPKTLKTANGARLHSTVHG